MFEWQRDHERRIAEQVGKAGADARKRYEDRHLEEFGKLSYLSERLILEKGELWEYRLTTEVLRFEMSSVTQRWRALKRGLYIRPSQRLGRDDFIPWMMVRLHEVSALVEAFSGLVNDEFARAWGEDGVPGVDTEIVAACRLFSEVCQSALEWEEAVRFVSVHDIYESLHEHFVGVAGRMLDEAIRLPQFLAETFGGSDKPEGTYKFTLTFSLPEGWSEAVELELERATAAYLADRE